MPTSYWTEGKSSDYLAGHTNPCTIWGSSSLHTYLLLPHHHTHTLDIPDLLSISPVPLHKLFPPPGMSFSNGLVFLVSPFSCILIKLKQHQLCEDFPNSPDKCQSYSLFSAPKELCPYFWVVIRNSLFLLVSLLLEHEVSQSRNYCLELQCLPHRVLHQHRLDD